MLWAMLLQKRLGLRALGFRVEILGVRALGFEVEGFGGCWEGRHCGGQCVLHNLADLQQGPGEASAKLVSSRLIDWISKPITLPAGGFCSQKFFLPRPSWGPTCGIYQTTLPALSKLARDRGLGF